MAPIRPIAIIDGLLRRRFVRDVLTLQSGSVLQHGISFVKSVLFARLLGLEGFGLYAVVLAFTGTVAIATNFGQNQAALTFLAEEHSKKNRDGIAGVLRYQFTLSLIAVILLALCAWFAPAATSVLYANTNSTLAVASQLGFLYLLSGSFDSIFTNVLQTIRSIRLLTILENVNTLLQLIFASVFLFFGKGVAGIFLGFTISNALMLCIYLVVYHRLKSAHHLPSIQDILRSKTPMRTYLKQGLWIALDKNIGNLYPKSFFFVLSLVAAPATVGIAQLAFKIGNLPLALFFPHVSRMCMSVLPSIRNEGLAKLRQACAQLVKHALFFHALISFGSLIVLPFLAIALYGYEYAAMINPMLWIILIHIFAALNVANSPLFRMFHKAHIPATFGMIKIPLELLLFFYGLQIFEPLNAFVLILLFDRVVSLWLNGYLYYLLKLTR